MKLFELDSPKSKNVASMMSKNFGKKVNFDSVTIEEAKMLLPKVNKLIFEHRQTVDFHSSEKTPAYLKLLMIEQVLRDKVDEQEAGIPVDVDDPKTKSVFDKLERGQNLTPDEQKIANAVASNVGDSQISEAGAKESFSVYKSLPPSAGRSLSNKVMVKAFKTRDDMGKFLSKGSNALHWKETGVEGLKSGQYRLNMVRGEDGKPAREFVKVTESLQSGRPTRRLDESDIEQAQVVLAAKDLVDRVQKMIEDISEVQYKELPALVDQTRTDLGTSEAESLNKNMGSALDQLMQTLQDVKEQMNNGLSVLTGEEAISVPGDDDIDIDPPEDMDSLDDVDLDTDDEVDVPDLDDLDEPEIDADLGRPRR